MMFIAECFYRYFTILQKRLDLRMRAFRHTFTDQTSMIGNSSHPEDQPPVLRPVSFEERHDGDFFDRQQGTHSDPEREVLGHEIGRKVQSALQALSPRERMVFEMRHYQGMKLRDIGEVLGTTEETAKNSLFRATRKLRTQLEGLR